MSTPLIKIKILENIFTNPNGFYYYEGIIFGGKVIKPQLYVHCAYSEQVKSEEKEKIERDFG